MEKKHHTCSTSKGSIFTIFESLGEAGIYVVGKYKGRT
jgi:hypothetical protein